MSETISGVPAAQYITTGATIEPFANVVFSDPSVTSVGVDGNAESKPDGYMSGWVGASNEIFDYSYGLTYPTMQQVMQSATYTASKDFQSVSLTIDTLNASATTTIINLSDEFGLTNTSSNQSSMQDGAAYSGPVTGLTSEYINISQDNLNITAKTPNAFIKSGSGEDALNVQASGGNNVLDGGTGSNFLVGGNGNDTFFLDDRSASASLWSTLVGFHAGDSATIWGVTANDFSITYADNQGAAGYQGLTINATSSTTPEASLTLAGFSQSDLAGGGRLSVSFGTTQDLPNLPGSTFMQISGH